MRAGGLEEVTALVTSVNVAVDRIAMHGVRRELLEAQAAALGLPVRIVPIPYPCPNGAYEAAFRNVVSDAAQADVQCMAFGDLFLEDIRAYREGLLSDTGIQPLFPIWGSDTTALARTMIGSGLRAKITCVDSGVMPEAFAGREFDQALLDDLPERVDPCGENGEFHTFAYSAPGFERLIEVRVGERVQRDGFVFCDLRLSTGEGPPHQSARNEMNNAG